MYLETAQLSGHEHSDDEQLKKLNKCRLAVRCFALRCLAISSYFFVFIFILHISDTASDAKESGWLYYSPPLERAGSGHRRLGTTRNGEIGRLHTGMSYRCTVRAGVVQ